MTLRSDLDRIVPVCDELVTLSDPGHVYRVGEGLTEREAVSLSRVISNARLTTDYSTVDPDYLAFRAKVGTSVHSWIEYWLQGQEFEEEDRFVALHAEPHIAAFQTWAESHELVVAYSEQPSYQPELKYACMADFIGYLDGVIWVIDWKTTSKIALSVALQTIGQRECFKFPMGAEIKRGALHLPKKGRAKLVQFSEDMHDYQTLQAIARTYHARGKYVK